VATKEPLKFVLLDSTTPVRVDLAGQVDGNMHGYFWFMHGYLRFI